MKNINKWQKLVRINKPIEYIFERGSGHDSMLERIFDKMDEVQMDFCRAAGGISFLGKETTPLQAADILAYENRLEMCRQVNPTNRPKVRESLKKLQRPENDGSYYNAEHVRTVLENAANMGLIQVW